MKKTQNLTAMGTDFYAGLHNGCFRFPKKHKGVLHSLLVTAANNLDRKEIRVRIAGKHKYAQAKKDCKLRGLMLQSVKISPYEYEFLAVIKPKVLLRQAEKFKTAAREVSLAVSIKPHPER